MIVLVSENNKQFNDKKQAETALAFCHYPVTVEIETDGDVKKGIFDSFDKAREFVENSNG